jgi:uncharacterized protein (DUF1778 family)
MAGITRSARVELRMTPEEKELLAAAAAREHLDVTSFVLRQVLPVAEELVSRPERRILREADAMFMMSLLDEVSAPTPALVEAARLARTQRLDTNFPRR